MSLHKSLRSNSKLERARNVLSREEQIEKLQEDEKWTDGDSVFGLPKVKVETIALRRRPKEEEEEAEAAEEGLDIAGEEGAEAEVAGEQ